MYSTISLIIRNEHWPSVCFLCTFETSGHTWGVNGFFYRPAACEVLLDRGIPHLQQIVKHNIILLIIKIYLKMRVFSSYLCKFSVL